MDRVKNWRNLDKREQMRFLIEREGNCYDLSCTYCPVYEYCLNNDHKNRREGKRTLGRVEEAKRILIDMAIDEEFEEKI